MGAGLKATCSAPLRAGLGFVGFEEDEDVAEMVAQAAECDVAVDKPKPGAQRR